MRTPAPPTDRPWTVKALVAWSLLATGLTLVLERSLSGSDIAGIAFAALTAWALWNGKSWMYTLIFAGFSLCAVGLGVATFTGGVDRSTLVRSWIAVVVGFYLLVHPATRAFAQTQRQPMQAAPQTSADAVQPVGVRRNTIFALMFLLAAIAIAGTLGVIRIYQMGG